jgi:hypothetical protein
VKGTFGHARAAAERRPGRLRPASGGGDAGKPRGHEPSPRAGGRVKADSAVLSTCLNYLPIAASVLALFFTVACEPVDIARLIDERELPLEVWDFSEGLAAEKANWGAEGWETATAISDSQFKGPVFLRILLPNDRAIEGRFELVHASRDRGQVYVSFVYPPTSAEEARDTVLTLLASADEAVSENNRSRVEAWYESGPVSGPGEQLNLILSEADSSTIEIGVTIDWVPSFGDEDGRWRVFGGLGPMPSRE